MQNAEVQKMMAVVFSRNFLYSKVLYEEEIVRVGMPFECAML